MKYLLYAIMMLWPALVCAQNLPPIQSIDTNKGVACDALGSQGAVEHCQPGWSYGCESTSTSKQIVATDGNRTSWQFQNTGTIPIVMCFGDDCMGSNGFVVQPGIPYLWSAQNRGNQPGGVNTASVSIISDGNSSCSFLFMN